MCNDLHSLTASVLRQEDIEGLIALGAPEDEYDSEAAEIAEAVNKLDVTARTQSNIAAIIALVWAQMFNHSPNEMEMRTPALQRVAERLNQALI